MRKKNLQNAACSLLRVLIVLILSCGFACSKKTPDDPLAAKPREGKPVPVEKLNFKKAEVFGDFIFLVPDDWSRAPQEMEREEKNYLFGNETIHPGGEPAILMIRQETVRYPDVAALGKSLTLIKNEWAATHPQEVPENMTIAGMEAFRLRDKVGKKGAAGESTLYKLDAKKGTKLYTLGLLIPLPNAPWPDYAKSLLDRLHLKEEMDRKGPAGRSFSQKLLDAVAGFRSGLRLDSVKAIQKFASPKVFKNFFLMEETLWPIVPAQRGWQEFAEQAVISFGTPSGDQAVVLFFDPWTDWACLTLWTALKDGSVKITDLEMLMGSALREPAKKNLTAEPAWYRQKAYAPFALGWHTTETIAAFQNIFGGPQVSPDQFRKLLPALADPSFATANQVAAALSRSWIRSTLADLLREDAPMPEYRLMAALVEALKNKTLAQLAQKISGSSEDILKMLGQLKPNDLESLRPVAFIAGKPKSVLLLSDAENPDLIMGIRFVRKGDEAFLDRLDLFSLNAFYLSRKEFGR